MIFFEALLVYLRILALNLIVKILVVIKVFSSYEYLLLVFKYPINQMPSKKLYHPKLCFIIGKVESNALLIWLVFFGFFVLCGCKKNQDPIVRFLQPMNGLEFSNDTVLEIELDASDEDGDLSSVSLLINDSLVTFFASAPYRFGWPVNVALTHGPIMLRAVAVDKNGGIGTDTVYLHIPDFRDSYLGEFNFMVIRESWLMGSYNIHDTTFQTGAIRAFSLDDSSKDLFHEDDSQENPADKISIEFWPNKLFISKVKPDGYLIPKTGFQYQQSGQFFGKDSIFFSVSSYGSLAGGSNYWVYGSRK